MRRNEALAPRTRLAMPAFLGLSEGDFQKVLRTLHLAYLAVGTDVMTVALDL